MSEQKESTFVGYVNMPSMYSSISFTEQELEDMKKFLKPNAKDPSKPARVYLDFKSGVSKKGNPYAFFAVRDPQDMDGGNQTYKKAETPEPVTQGDDLPF